MNNSADEKTFPQVPAGFIAVGANLIQVKAISRVEPLNKGVVLHLIGGGTHPVPSIGHLEVAAAMAETLDNHKEDFPRVDTIG